MPLVYFSCLISMALNTSTGWVEVLGGRVFISCLTGTIMNLTIRYDVSSEVFFFWCFVLVCIHFILRLFFHSSFLFVFLGFPVFWDYNLMFVLYSVNLCFTLINDYEITLANSGVIAHGHCVYASFVSVRFGLPAFC